ncbi:MAG: methionine biosynthesis protein MetW, partial [Proteobacteria bacterium]|nr:methionine biosynthesis protein MetW [Pseudomonadota bacterium]
HMCTIKDFVNFIKFKEIKMIKTLALNSNNTSNITTNNLGTKNLFADLGIFLIEK